MINFRKHFKKNKTLGQYTSSRCIQMGKKMTNFRVQRGRCQTHNRSWALAPDRPRFKSSSAISGQFSSSP